ncbi:PAS/PAC sensor signal transduction histidine kinase [Hymenobacter roseosalivarius DSM 11622]|uniref:histidine kinase n=1 Tax=Hymenobacter roseosalivarius DSM 11622 TaxID=645990 RepID=A0A1W1W2E7_9BACT|nr:PAS domain-containing sensor histidine kinase [Hymenobacter roseosalivarius]SMB99673.1 PAS/PAC sensor signal transduction histidine kinase [Hymenobacter roseosalivarius DSM 11622]
MLPTPSALPQPQPATDELQALLDVSLTALTLLRPLYGPQSQELTDFAFDYLNPAGQRLLGLAQRPTTTFLASFPRAHDTGVFAFYRGVLETGEAGRFEVTYVHEGVDTPFYVAARRHGPGLAVSLIDTAAHAQAPVEVALRASQAREQLAQTDAQHQRASLERFLSQTQATVCILRGPTHRLDYCNPAYRRLFPSRLLPLGRPLPEVHPDVNAPGLLARLNHVYQTGKSYLGVEQPLTITPHAGQPPRTHYFTFSYDAYLEQGQIAGVSIFAYDVTAQVRASQQATQAAAELQLLTANVPVFLFRTDAAGHLTYVNEALFAWSGLSPSMSNLDEVWRTVHPEDTLALTAAFTASLAARQAWESPVYRIRRRDGEYRWSLTRTQPLLQADGQLIGYSGVNVEIHDQVEMQRQLARVNSDLDTFMYTASHELKTPLTNLEGLLYALQEELPPALNQGELVPPLLALMQQSLDRFRLTLAQLTDISKLQRAHAPPAEAVDLVALLDDIRRELGPLVTASAAHLTVELTTSPRVCFAPKHLRTIVYQLLSNALKYCAPDRAPRIAVRAYEQPGYAVLEVQDNGLGLGPAHVSQLFTLFRRFHDHVEGTGIGLYMVKRLVDNAGGRIVVQSELGVGTIFSVFFPR